MLIAFLACFLLGLSKAGLKGLGMVVVALIAIVYGAKASTGILLPLLIVGDILAVIYYNRHTQWRYLVKFLPAMITGVVLASWIGRDIPDAVFKQWFAVLILASLAILIWFDRKAQNYVPDNWLFAGSTGVAAGFATMIGNLAGAFANLFFLATRLPKNALIGTSAWLFFIINIFKVPFHFWSWKTITPETLLVDLNLIPAVILGFMVGIRIVALFNEKQFRYFLFVVTGIAALVILIK